MKTIEQHRARLAVIVANFSPEKMQELDTYAYFEQLVDVASFVAEIACYKKIDFNGNSQYAKACRVADKASSFLDDAAVMLYAAVEVGEDVGVTIGFLRDTLRLPVPLLDQVQAMLREADESWSMYFKRVEQNFLATRSKLNEFIDAADITSFVKPTKEDHFNCCAYLGRAMTLKNSEQYQRELPFEAINTIIAISEISPVQYRFSTETYSNADTIHQRIVFNHEGFRTDSYTLDVIATKCHKVVQVCLTPTKHTSAEKVIRPYKQIFKFETVLEVAIYFEEITARIMRNLTSNPIPDVQEAPVVQPTEIL